ncbi:MAG: transposase [Actinomycetota bacterium]|nr:transposase [Actinomycetota bacterium]
MNGTSTRRVKVESGGKGVVAHVGLHALGAFADRMGLGDALSSAIPWGGNGIPVHDRGKVLTQMALVLAGGGESCLDIEHLRIGGVLFGSVPSDTTVARTFHEIQPRARAAIAEAAAKVRTAVWRRSSATNGTDRVVLDIDASLVEVHSENKELEAVLLTAPLADQVRGLVERGVSVIACSTTMRQHGVAADQLLAGVRVVPSGVGQLVRRQRAGWAYLRP